MIRRAGSPALPPSSLRCAIYCRVSTVDQAQGEFTSIDNQRAMAEAYISSQAGKNWVVIDEHFDDPGFSASTTDRPALQRLLAAVDARRVDLIVAYRLDRLSRSLSDFMRLMDRLRAAGVEFVSVTESFSTDNAVGRLTMGLLATFAEFERATIADRTRDKMAGARRRGRWTGGIPVLGYDVRDKKLIINEPEAAMIREIFRLYLADQSISEVVEEINCRGWVTKSCTTKTGRRMGAVPFTKNAVNYVLNNVLYTGKTSYLGEVYEGEHEAIVDEKTFQRVQDLMAKNARTHGTQVQNKYGFLLKGIVHCVACGAKYTPSVSRKGPRVYRSYVCSSAMKKGHSTCPCPTIKAQRLEDIVVGQIRTIGQDRDLQRETVRQVAELRAAKRPALMSEQKRLRTRLEKVRGQLRQLVDALATGDHGATVAARIASLEEHAGKVERRLVEIAQELAALDAGTVDEADLAKALAMFTPIWDMLYPVEQARVIQLLVERIEHDPAAGKLAVTFAPAGVRALAGEADASKEDVCASN